MIPKTHCLLARWLTPITVCKGLFRTLHTKKHWYDSMMSMESGTRRISK